MHVIFDTLIDSFIENKIGIAQHFLSESLALHLKENLVFLYRDSQLKSAGTGEHTVLKINNLSRGDKIHWLDRKNNNIHENTFFDLMDDFVLYLNANCYTGIKSYEFHYTLYEKGSFYIKHLDQFRNNDSRKFSMIFYLNLDWVASDGGELCIHFGNKKINISPNSGKTVFFQSNELEHEVLLTNKARMSITGWLKG